MTTNILFKYKGATMDNVVRIPTDGTATTTVTVSDYYNNLQTALSNSVVEKYHTTYNQLGYSIGGVDIINYACPAYDSWSPSNTAADAFYTVSIPSWAKYMTVVCIGGGGGGGAGSNGFKRNDPVNQGKASQNGGGGGGASGAEYKIFRGLDISALTDDIQVAVGDNGTGGTGSGAPGNAGNSSIVKLKQNGVVNMTIEARGGNAGDGGAEGNGSNTSAGNSYYPFIGNQWRGSSTDTTSNYLAICRSGNAGQGNARAGGTGGVRRDDTFVNPLTLNPVTSDYLTIFPNSNYGVGGDGGTGSNYDDQGRGDGGNGGGGYVRIYWMP